MYTHDMGTFPGTSGHTRSLQSARKPPDIENRGSGSRTYTPSDQLPLMVFEAKFLEYGKYDRTETLGSQYYGTWE